MDVRTRIERLLALAADAGASENEARNAAVTAARLIREHGFRLVAGPAAAPRWPHPWPQPRPARARARKAPTPAQRRAAAAELERQQLVMRAAEEAEQARLWAEMDQQPATALTRAKCLQCGRFIAAGARCSWVRDFGLRCLRCVATG